MESSVYTLILYNYQLLVGSNELVYIDARIIFSFFFFSSMTIHPNKLLVATGQTAGHDNREGKVRSVKFNNNNNNIFINLISTTIMNIWLKIYINVVNNYIFYSPIFECGIPLVWRLL